MKPPRSVILFSYIMLAVAFLSSYFGLLFLTGPSVFAYIICADWTWLDEAAQHYSRIYETPQKDHSSLD